MKARPGQGFFRLLRGMLTLLWAIAGLSGSACEPYTRPNRPLPEGFSAKLLAAEGAAPVAIDRSYFEGRPWVIELWVPG